MPTAVTFGRFRILLHRRELLADNQPVDLGARAFDVLMALIEARGTVVSKLALIERVWPDRIVEENNLRFQISVLRKAFADDRDLIRTVSGRGYQFTGEIRAVSTSTDPRMNVAMPDPVATPSRPPTNLPEPVSELIGRDAELGEILGHSASHRLVTLSGAGGIGKTRLGLAVARHQVAGFADGVWVAELAPLSDPDLVPVTVAIALGLELGSGTASPQSVANALRSKRLMLVLDNCEHVIDAAARMAEALLRANPAARVIATSREPLRADGELVYRVPPLAVPPEGNPDSEDPLRYGAVRLFGERARITAANFSPDAGVAAAIAGICRRLDGIPLAIELAAARVTALGIEGLVARLDDRFRLIARGRRTALPRHQTLRGTLDWSYELLTEPERMGLRRLAIFAGGFTLRAARAVLADDEITATEVDNCVASLVAKSLVTADVIGAMLRYRLLETTRSYAIEKLVQAAEFDTVARRHARHCLDHFDRAGAEAQTQPADEWLADNGPRIDNLRAALDWAFSPVGDASIGVPLTAAAVPLWMHLSLMEECRGRVRLALAAIATGTVRDARREMQLQAALATSLMSTRGAVSEVGAAGTKALELAESLGNTEYQLRSLWGLWSFRIGRGQHCVALALAEKFHTVAAKRSEANDRPLGERLIGTSEYYLGDLLSARRHMERVLAPRVTPASKWQIVRIEVDERSAAWAFLARILWLQGLPDQAMRSAERCVADARATNHAISLGHALVVAACPIALWIGDLAAAEHYVGMLLDHATRHLLARWRAYGSCYQGMLAIQRGDVNTGLRLLRAAFVGPAGIGSAPRLLAFLVSAASGHAGQIADGLDAFEEAIDRSELAEERWLNAELLRVKGEYLLLRDVPGATAAAENQFRQALDWARQQGALSWELRAATSLARLWHDQARSQEAHELLAPVYDRFAEGFATADLRAARTLIEEMLLLTKNPAPPRLHDRPPGAR
jgi:predicted ATPase/DNA-binding winged helix-turn-helix (wHTH) protein